MKQDPEHSTGLLVYRNRVNPGVRASIAYTAEILLAHPGGPFWSKKDQGSWSIPKGIAQPGDPLASARRAFTNETGFVADGDFISVLPVEQKAGKTLHSFAVEADLDLKQFRSREFTLEWPPGSGRLETFPEIDRLEYLSLRTALRKILPYQWPILLDLAEKLGWHVRGADRGERISA